jgi:RND superfamily putative drug exporter
VILGLTIGTFLVFGGGLTSQVTIPGTATEAVQKQLADQFPVASGGSGSVVFKTTDGSAFTDAQKTQIEAALKSTGDIDGVKGYLDPFATQAKRSEQQAKLDNGDQQISAGRTELADGQKRLDTAQASLNQGRAQLDAASATADDAAKQQLQAQAAWLGPC